MAEADHADHPDEADREIDDEIDDDEEERLIQEGLREIWQRAQPDHIAALEAAADLFGADADGVDQAIDHIHRVAGTLGVFGLAAEGQRLRAIEAEVGDAGELDDELRARAIDTVWTVRDAVQRHTP